MKIQTSFLLKKLTPQQITSLTNEVRETLDKKLMENNRSKTFTAIDLWNIQRRSKTAFVKRHYA